MGGVVVELLQEEFRALAETVGRAADKSIVEEQQVAVGLDGRV